MLHHVACITTYRGTWCSRVVGGQAWRVVASGGWAMCRALSGVSQSQKCRDAQV